MFNLGSWIPDPSFFHPGSWILDPNFSILDPWSQIWTFSITDPGSRMHIKEFKYFNQKNGFSALKNMIRVFHPGSGSRIWILTFYLSQIPILDPRSRIQGSKRNRIPDPGSWIRIRNTGDFWFAQVVGGSIGYWLLGGAAVLTTHLMDQVSEAFMSFMCKKEFSVYFVLTLSLKFLPFWSYDALRICFLTHLVHVLNKSTYSTYECTAFDDYLFLDMEFTHSGRDHSKNRIYYKEFHDFTK